MKPLILLTALLGLTLSVQAADPAPSKGSAPAPKKTDAAPAKTEEKPAEKAAKAQPWSHKVDAIDAAEKTLTFTVKKTGVKEVNKVTDKTVIMQGEKAATLDEIKVGDVVSGSRIKTGEGTFDIVKITKFVSDSDKEAKPKASEKPGADTPATPTTPKKNK